MKKLIIAIAAVLVAVNANAQAGVIAGVTSSKTDYKEAWASAKDINQFHVGATLKLPLPLGFAIQPSLLYNMKGTSIGAATEKTEDFKVDSKAGYLELPVQVQWGIGIAGVVRPYVFAEPFIGYLVTEDVKVSNYTGTASKENLEKAKNQLEYGFGLGAGVEILRHLQVSVRYFWNMGSLYDEEGNAAWKDIMATIDTSAKTAEEQKCNGVMASIAFLF